MAERVELSIVRRRICWQETTRMSLPEFDTQLTSRILFICCCTEYGERGNELL